MKPKNKLLIAILLVITIGVTGMVIFSFNKEILQIPKNMEPLNKSFFIDPSENIDGVSVDLGDGWKMYTNTTLGFRLEYPGYAFAYGVLEPSERKQTRPFFEDELGGGDTIYTVGFSDGDSARITVSMRTAYVSSLEEWRVVFLDSQPDYLESEELWEFRNITITDQEALFIRRIPSFEDQYEEEQLADEVYILRDGMLIQLHVWYLPKEDRERILASFQFLE